MSIGIAADNQMYQSMSDLLNQPGASGPNADFHSSFARSGISYTNHDVSYDLDENITTMENSKNRDYTVLFIHLNQSILCCLTAVEINYSPSLELLK